MKRTMVAVAMVWMACGDDGGSNTPRDAGLDAAIDAPPTCIPPMAPTGCGATAAPTAGLTSDAICNPLTQTGCAAGEKCTWIQDSSIEGHVGCAPDGTIAIGCACTRGTPGVTGYDDCVKGSYCLGGTCKQICDQQGGAPACDADHACTVHDNVFDLGEATPAAAGVCDRACDPLADNDFLGSGTRPGCSCEEMQGCYGTPSYGTPPSTAFTCTREISTTLVHRSPIDPPLFVNGCAQGYLPLLVEMTGSSTVVCVAMCKPMNCYAGNCGPNDENRLGAAPHRCNSTDRRGTFDTAPGAEHCQFLWSREVDTSTGTYLPSPYGDTVGICYDHSKYLYDSDQNPGPDAPLPACADLQDGFGTGTDPGDPVTYFGAADLGCVDSTRAMATGKPMPRRRRHPFADARLLHVR